MSISGEQIKVVKGHLYQGVLFSLKRGDRAVCGGGAREPDTRLGEQAKGRLTCITSSLRVCTCVCKRQTETGTKFVNAFVNASEGLIE